MRTLEQLLEALPRGLYYTRKPDKLRMPIFNLPLTEEGVAEFNLLYKYFNEYEKAPLTKGGRISYANQRAIMCKTANTAATSTSVEITVHDDGWYRIQLRTIDTKDDSKAIYGRQAFKKFIEHLKKYDINLEDYASSDGYKYKLQIKKPLIRVEDERDLDKVFTNCHHIDFHNSYPAGLVNTHPEFKDAITELYEKRKQNNVYKAILNLSIGFMQSEYCGYKYAELSRDAVNDNYYRVIHLAEQLRNSGRKILLYNTDGIWYQGPVFHFFGEGSKLGEWHNDHTNCTFRAKSNGCYEFIENGVYYPVVRGKTVLDREKPRNTWVWGDIYVKATPIKYQFLENKGVEVYEEK